MTPDVPGRMNIENAAVGHGGRSCAPIIVIYVCIVYIIPVGVGIPYVCKSTGMVLICTFTTAYLHPTAGTVCCMRRAATEEGK